MAPIRQACRTAGHPILTQTQLIAFTELAAPRDANALSEVTVFATGHTATDSSGSPLGVTTAIRTAG